MNCPQCGAAVPPGSDFCGECGTRIEAAPPACAQCGTTLGPDDAFCQNCGTPAAAVAPPATAAPPPPQQQAPPPPPVGMAPPPPPPGGYQPPPPPPAGMVPPPPRGVHQAPPPQAQGGGILIPLGYLFSLLGGLLGIAIGGALWQSKGEGPMGQKVPKYNAGTRRHGIAMLALGGVAIALSLQFADQITGLVGGGTTDRPAVSTTVAGSATGGGEQTARPASGGTESAQPSPPSGGGTQPARPSGGGSQPSSGGAARSLSDLGLNPSTAPADGYEELVLSYLDTAYGANLQDEGFGAAIHRQFGALGQGRSEDVSLTLPAGSEIAIFGTCDNECSDFNFMLFSQDGRMVDEDTTADDIPLVVVQTGSSATRYTLRVDMASCSIEPCYYALGVYRR